MDIIEDPMKYDLEVKNEILSDEFFEDCQGVLLPLLQENVEIFILFLILVK